MLSLVETIYNHVDNGCLPPLVRLLKCDNLGSLKHGVRLVTVAIEGIENILKRGQRNLNDQGRNPFVGAVEMCGGVDKIENLLNTLYLHLSAGMCGVFGGGTRQLSEAQAAAQSENLKIYNLLLNICKNYLAGNVQKTSMYFRLKLFNRSNVANISITLGRVFFVEPPRP